MDPDTLVIDIRDDEAAAVIRDEAGRYPPGVSGNPQGRPLGSRRVQALARALAEVGIEVVVLRDRARQPRSPSGGPSGAPSARRPRGRLPALAA